MLGPRLLVLDEPTSALNRAVQADILGLLRRREAKRTASGSLTTQFITYDLAVVQKMAGKVAVTKNGWLVEIGPAQNLMDMTRNAYRRSFLVADPRFGA